MRVKSIKEQDALRFAWELVTLYFGKRDMEALLDYMEARTSWIGTGESELSRNLSEAETALLAERNEYSGGFSVTDSDLAFTPLSATGGIVYGTLTAVPFDRSLSDEHLRLSVALEQSGDGLKLVHMHFSHADPAQERGRYFVKQAARGDNEALRQELNLRERQLANLTKNIPGGAHQCANDPSLTLLSMSDGFLAMFGYTREEVETLFDGKFLNMVYPGDRAKMLKTTYEQLERGADIELEYRVLCKSGQPVWVLDQGRLMDDGTEGRCFYCLLMDITERKRQEEELRLSLERHQVIMDQATDIIFEWNILRDTLSFSSNWEKKFGYSAIDTHISGRIPLSENIHADDIAAFLKIMRDTAAGVPYSETEFRIRDKAGRFYWCRIRATVQFSSEGQPVKAVGVIADIDEEKKHKEALLAQAQHDELTGIYNKAAINALVEQRMRGGNATGCQALLIIDVDHFKAVNDTYGHLCGDNVLSDVASALMANIRPCDLAGRIGGDEFLVYLSATAGQAAVQEAARRILDTVGRIRPESAAPPISCSIGGVVAPHGSADYQAFCRQADQALYHQKSSRRGGATVLSFEEWEDGSSCASALSTADYDTVSSEAIAADKWLDQYTFRKLCETRELRRRWTICWRD